MGMSGNWHYALKTGKARDRMSLAERGSCVCAAQHRQEVVPPALRDSETQSFMKKLLIVKH